MKSVLLTIIIFSISILGISQNHVAIFAGPQATGTLYSVYNQKQDQKMKFGFQAGASMKVPFENKLFFAPAAFYSLKGYDVTYSSFNSLPDVNAKDNSTRIHTFELAALLQYDFNNKPGHFFIKAGPSLDFQLFGNEKYNLNNGSGSIDRKMSFAPNDYGRYSANLLGQIGYETIAGFMIFAQYSHGAANISNRDGGPSIKHRAYGISIGKYLRSKR